MLENFKNVKDDKIRVISNDIERLQVRPSILDQIFGTEPETHTSVTCPDCGSLVSYSSDLEFHNCPGGF